MVSVHLCLDATNEFDMPRIELLLLLKYINRYVPGFNTDVSENFKHIPFEPSGKASGKNFTLHADVISNRLYSSFDSSISTVSDGK